MILFVFVPLSYSIRTGTVDGFVVPAGRVVDVVPASRSDSLHRAGVVGDRSRLGLSGYARRPSKCFDAIPAGALVPSSLSRILSRMLTTRLRFGVALALRCVPNYGRAMMVLPPFVPPRELCTATGVHRHRNRFAIETLPRGLTDPSVGERLTMSSIYITCTRVATFQHHNHIRPQYRSEARRSR